MVSSAGIIENFQRWQPAYIAGPPRAIPAQLADGGQSTEAVASYRRAVTDLG
jgi:hypothetical protein